MSSFVLYSRDSGAEIAVNSSNPSVTIGRMTGNVCPDDREVSRTQISLSVTPGTSNTITATVLGINHSAVFRGGKGDAVLLKQGEKMDLTDGDVFLLSKERWEWEVRRVGGAAAGRDDAEEGRSAAGRDGAEGGGPGDVVGVPKGGSAVDSLFLPSDVPSFRPHSIGLGAAGPVEPPHRWPAPSGSLAVTPSPALAKAPAPVTAESPAPASILPLSHPQSSLPSPGLGSAALSKTPTPLPVKTIAVSPLSLSSDHHYLPDHALAALLSEVRLFLEPRRGQGVTVIVCSFPAELLSHPLWKGCEDLTGSGELVVDARSAVDVVLGRGGVGVVSNACNWRLKRGAMGTLNRAVFDAAGGEAHEKRAKDAYQVARLGEAFLVQTEPDSRFRLAAGVKAVIHALGPTMNPDSQDSLGGDYEKADALLRSSYRAIFALFWRAAAGEGPNGEAAEPAPAGHGGGGLGSGDGRHLPAGQVSAVSGLPRLPANLPGPPLLPSAANPNAPASSSSGEHLPSSQGWLNALRAIALDPKAHSSSILDQDEHTVVIRDKYPKARVHLLILCRADIPGPSALTVAHLPVLEAMEAMAERQMQRLIASQPPSSSATPAFLLGFHAVPSMRQLHLHLLSSDLDSECLKHKKHYNSFATPFLIDIRAVVWALRLGRFHIDADAYEKYLALPLTCLRCKRECSNIPSLKEHLRGCKGL